MKNKNKNKNKVNIKCKIVSNFLNKLQIEKNNEILCSLGVFINKTSSEKIMKV